MIFPAFLRRSSTVDSESSSATQVAAASEVQNEENVIEVTSTSTPSKCNVSQHDLSVTLYGTPEQLKADPLGADEKGGMPNLYIFFRFRI